MKEGLKSREVKQVSHIQCGALIQVPVVSKVHFCFSKEQVAFTTLVMYFKYVYIEVTSGLNVKLYT